MERNRSRYVRCGHRRSAGRAHRVIVGVPGGVDVAARGKQVHAASRIRERRHCVGRLGGAYCYRSRSGGGRVAARVGHVVSSGDNERHTRCNSVGDRVVQSLRKAAAQAHVRDRRVDPVGRYPVDGSDDVTVCTVSGAVENAQRVEADASCDSNRSAGECRGDVGTMAVTAIGSISVSDGVEIR